MIDRSEIAPRDTDDSVLRVALDAVGFGVALLRLDGELLYWNAVMREILGAGSADVAGRSIAGLVSPGSRSEVLESLDRLAGGAGSLTRSVELLRPEGGPLQTEVRLTPAALSGEQIACLTIIPDTQTGTSSGSSLRESQEALLTVLEASSAEAANQRALEESEAALARGQKLAHVGTWSVDLATGERQWSDEMFRMLGLEPQSVEPSQLLAERFLSAADQARLHEVRRAGELGDGTFETYLRHRRPDGEIRTHWVRAELARDEQGRPLRWEGATQDVTDLDRSRETLAARERFLQSTLEAVQSGIMVVDPGGQILSANPQASEIFGYERGELVGLSSLDLVPEEERTRFVERGAEWSSGETEVASSAYRITQRGGAWVDVETRSAPLVTDGEFRGAVIDIRDVTAANAATAALVERELQLARGERFARVGSWTIDGATGQQRWSDELFRLFGLEPGEIEPSREAANGFLVPSDRERLAEAAAEAEAGDGIIDLEVDSVGADGVARRFWLRSERRVDSRGNEIYRRGVLQDISELYRAREELAERSRERQRLVERLFVAQEEERRTVAYDIHDGPAQQLAAAQMFLEAFENESETPIEPAPATYLQRARTLLASGLEDTRRIMSGLRPSMLDDLGLAESLNQLLEEQGKSSPIVAELEVRGVFTDLRPEVEITLYRVAQEAVANAVKHSETDQVRVELRWDQGAIRLDVRDWGLGFDPAAIAEPRDGYRYGLVGMRERVSLLGGELSIESAAGAGTTVTATIPGARQED